MRPFSLLIKPASADCNLRCEYCFYLDRASLYPSCTVHRMSSEVMQHLFRSYLALPMPEHVIAFQGGEPLMMGEQFYRDVVKTQQRYARPDRVISNSVQTNVTLMTPTLASFLAKNDFLIGVSVDGSEDVHDLRRKRIDGKGSHAQVLQGIHYLDEVDAQYNILTLVSQSNVHDPIGLYLYLRDTIQTKFMQFIECVEFCPDGSLAPYAITPKQWGHFLCELFDYWYKEDTHRISIRLFDSLIAKIALNQIHTCSLGMDCRQYLVVEYNGDVYPCDFYVQPEYKLGNIMENDWDELFDNPVYAKFGARKRQFNDACKICPHLDLCAGDCPKNRVGHGAFSDPTRLSSLCSAWRIFYAHCRPRLEHLALEVRSRHAQSTNAH